MQEREKGSRWSAAEASSKSRNAIRIDLHGLHGPVLPPRCPVTTMDSGVVVWTVADWMAAEGAPARWNAG